MALLNEVRSKQKKNKIGAIESDFSDCDIVYAYNALQRSPWSKYYLLLDIRSTEEYNKAHIYNAINLDFEQRTVKDMKAIKKLSEIPCSKPGCLKFISDKKIVIYAKNVEDTTMNEEKLKILKELLIKEEKVVNCRILRNGFAAFREKYQFFVVNNSKQRLPKYPHEIIPNKLYLGNGQQATTEQIISNLKITHIANISIKFKCAFPEKVKYCNVQIDDLEDEDILSHIPKVVDFINSALNATNPTDDQKEQSNVNNHRVLVHCEYGISRSSSMVIAYLMFKHKWSFEEAKKYVKGRRPQISPNDGFVQALKEYQEIILSKNQTSIEVKK